MTSSFTLSQVRTGILTAIATNTFSVRFTGFEAQEDVPRSYVPPTEQRLLIPGNEVTWLVGTSIDADGQESRVSTFSVRVIPDWKTLAWEEAIRASVEGLPPVDLTGEPTVSLL